MQEIIYVKDTYALSDLSDAMYITKSLWRSYRNFVIVNQKGSNMT